jgi:hypothetical protein
MFSLQALSWIKFVHFELYSGELVDVRKVDDIPPPEHLQYRYAPVPPDVIPPGMKFLILLPLIPFLPASFSLFHWKL